MRLDARRLAKFAAAAAVVAFWAVTLRPEALGGNATYIVVRGNSMEPTYHTGDLVIGGSSSEYAVGDIVAYRVPAGEIGEGHVVVHRIVGGDSTAGFVMRGDNNGAPDPWSPRIGDIEGRAWLLVPGLGSLIAFVHQPVIAGGLAASIMVTMVIAGSSRTAARPRVPADVDPLIGAASGSP
jgi:signal peptidase